MKPVINKPRFVIPLSVRVFMGFMAFSLPVLLLILFLLPKIDTVLSLSSKIYDVNLSGVLDTQFYQARDVVTHWIITGEDEDQAKFKRIWSEINNTKEKWDTALEKLRDEEIQLRWNKMKELYIPVYQAQQAIMNTPRNTANLDNLKKNLLQIRVIEDQIIDIIDGFYSPSKGYRIGGLYNDIMEQITQNTSSISVHLVTLKKFTYGLLIFTILLTIIVPLVTLRTIAGPIDNTIDIAERIAAGERDVDIQIFSTDQLGKMLLSLKTMQQAIKEKEEQLRKSEEESRHLLEELVASSKKFSMYTSKVAAGDLRDRLDIDKEDILYDFGNDLNLMTDGFSTITKNITVVSSDIVTMISKLVSSANEQTEGITSQASAINEISASLEEIDKSSKQTMAKAQMLREMANNTHEQGKLGTESVAQSINGIKVSVEKMKLIVQTILDLSSHTQQIGEITAVVNTLAQQLKMLALNAAIEASKAGEAGKGFAAVATEVKNLAEQSEQSTVQVQKILEDISRTTEKAVTVTEEGTKTLDSGTQLIEKTGSIIEALSQMINEASISSQHIEVAIRQETIGIEQIVESMTEINRATATFSDGIKEMMEFIHKLDKIAQHLKNDMSVYKV